MKEMTKKTVLNDKAPPESNDNDSEETPEDELLVFGSRAGIRKSSKFLQVSKF